MRNQYTEPIAVIDVGAHSIRMEIAQYDKKGNKELLNQIEDSIFLGADVFTKGKITSKNIRQASAIISDCSRLMKEYGVQKYKAVATSAVREAVNQDIFINRIKSDSGIDLNVMEPPEEMKLIFLAVKDAVSKRFGLQNHNTIICSIGTGSTQLAFIEKGHFKTTQTLNFGTLRLIEEIFSNVSSQKLKESIDPFIENVVGEAARMAPRSKSDLFIVVGATVRALVEVDRKLAPKQIATISYSAFSKLASKISGLTPDELVNKYNITDSIAIGLEPCCNLLEHIFSITSSDRLVIPIINTRDVILREILRESSGKPDAFYSEIISSAKFLGEKYNYDFNHAVTVSKTALQLFDKLTELHRLGQKERLLLELAGYLHDVGQFISPRQHHKHSYYIIKNSSIPGLSQDDHDILALVCRYHRKSPPKKSHIEYSALSLDKRITVCKLASILRLADALDRAHHSRITIKKVKYDNQKLNIHIASTSPDLTLECWGLKNKSDLFFDIYGLKVSLTGDE